MHATKSPGTRRTVNIDATTKESKEARPEAREAIRIIRYFVALL